MAAHVHGTNLWTITLAYDIMGGFRGGVQSHTIKYNAIDVLSHADALIYIAKSLVVVVVMF